MERSVFKLSQVPLLYVDEGTNELPTRILCLFIISPKVCKDVRVVVVVVVVVVVIGGGGGGGGGNGSVRCNIKY